MQSAPDQGFVEAVAKIRYERTKDIKEEDFNYDERPLYHEGIPMLSPEEKKKKLIEQNPYYDQIQALPDNKVLFGLIDKVLSEQHMTDNHVCFK